MPGLRLLATHPKTWCDCELFCAGSAARHPAMTQGTSFIFTVLVPGITLVIPAGMMQQQSQTHGPAGALLAATR